MTIPEIVLTVRQPVSFEFEGFANTPVDLAPGRANEFDLPLDIIVNQYDVSYQSSEAPPQTVPTWLAPPR